jgi:hypothetical protein
MNACLQHLWAIDTNDGENGFIGRYWAEEGFPSVNHPVSVRLFDTRQSARNFLRKMQGKTYQAFPKACVARVQVEVRVVE